MKFLSLQGSGIKGATFKHELAPVTMFYGDNFDNKSTRLEAFTLALAGYLPGVATKPNELYELMASSNPMEVRVETDTEPFWRRYTQDSKGSVKCTGIDQSFPPVSLDPLKFLSLSGPAQTRFLFECADMGPQCTVANLAKTVTAAIKNIKLEANTEDSEWVINELVNVVMAKASVGTGTPVQEWLAALVEQLRIAKNAAVEVVKRMTQTGQGLTQVATERKTAPQDAEAKLAKARDAKEAADAQCIRLQTQVEGLREQWQQANAKVKQGQQVADTAPLLKERETLEKSLAACSDETKLSKYTRPSGNKLPWTAAEWGDETATRQETYWQLQQQLETSQDVVKSLQTAIDNAKTSKCCETCGQSLAKVRKATVAKLQKQFKPAEREVSAYATKCNGAKALYEEAKTLHHAACEREKGLVALWEGMLCAKQRIAEIATLLAAHASMADAAKEAAKLIQDAAPVKLELSQATVAQTLAFTALQAATDDYNLLVQQRAEQATKAAAAAKARKVKVEVEVLKEACVKVAELQAELVNASVGPLIKTMNKVAGNILPGPLGFKDGLLGTVDPKNGTCYTHRTMSGTQKLLAYAALSVALATKAPAKVILLDELGRLHPKRKLDFLLHLVALCQDHVLDQVLVVDVVQPMIADSEWFRSYEV